MLDLIKVAIRNVGRNKRRSLITMLTVFLGVVVSTATRGLLNGLQEEIRGSLTRKIHGDLQIHRNGYQDSLESNPYKFLIPADPTNMDWKYSPRIRVMGMLNHQKSQTTTPVVITAIDSRREADVCPRFLTSVQTGEMLDSGKEVPPQVAKEEYLGEAQGLDASGPDTPNSAATPKSLGYQQIMITPSLMRGFGAAIGDEIVVLFNDKNNMQQAVIATLVGIVDVATPGAATRMAWMDLHSIQDRLGVEGMASEIAVRIPDTAVLENARDQLAKKLSPDHLVETWKDLGGFLRDAMALQDAVFGAIVGIMFAIVIAAIINTSLMTVMERTREIGTLMALGYRRRHILLLFLTESAVIGGGGGLAGIGVGLSLLKFLSINGLTITLPGQSVSAVLYPSISPTFIALLLGLSVSTALLAGLAPALRASHMKPVEALTTN